MRGTKILDSQVHLVEAWVLAVGPPLLVGLAPFGVGSMAAANYVQYVMKQTIQQAVQTFGQASTVIVDDLTESEILADGGRPVPEP